jgi:hypothetical protein
MSGHRPWSEIKHKASVAERSSQIEYSCSPFAPLGLDGHADAMDRILDALESDDRAIAPVVSFDDEVGRVDALFQVELAGGFSDAVETAAAIFDDALLAADVDATTVGVTVVIGGPEGLP